MCLEVVGKTSFNPLFSENVDIRMLERPYANIVLIILRFTAADGVHGKEKGSEGCCHY